MKKVFLLLVIALVALGSVNCHAERVMPTTYEELLTFEGTNLELYEHLIWLSVDNKELFDELFEEMGDFDNVSKYINIVFDSFRSWTSDNIFGRRDLENTWEGYLAYVKNNKESQSYQNFIKSNRVLLLHYFYYLFFEYDDFLSETPEEIFSMDDYLEGVFFHETFLKRSYPLLIYSHNLTDDDIDELVGFFINLIHK